MKILAHCYTYGHNATSGADRMLQSLMEYLASKGADCLCVIDNCPQPYVLNGVRVQSNRSLLGEAYDWCDVVIIHLVAIHEAVTIAKRFGKPIVHICHNNHVRPTAGNIVYNTHHLAQEMNLPLNSIVVHPPTKRVQPEQHYGAKYITLVNCNLNKGGKMLIDLARNMPRYNFLGIHGGYDKDQMRQPLPNVMYRAYNADGVDYSDTRIVIVPSKAESWSLVAAEAMARGIPVICSDLPGLRENCGNAAIYANSVRDYMDAIIGLNDEWQYRDMMEAGIERFASHNYEQELNLFYNFIENIVMKDKPKEKVVAKPVKEKKVYKGLPTQKPQTHD